MSLKKAAHFLFFLLFSLQGFSEEFLRHCDILEKRCPPINDEEYIQSQTVLTTKLNGILLLSDHNLLHKNGVHHVNGISAQNLRIPGGLDKLRLVLEPFLHTCLTLEVLDQIEDKIMKYYREECRPLMTIEVPEQDITDGVLELIIIESTLGKITSCGNKWFPDSLFFKNIRLEEGDPIQSDRLLNDIAWLNRSPFHLTDIIFTPGEKEYTTDVELITKDRFPVRWYVGGDNTGTQITGRPRWFTGIDWDIPYPCEQILSYQFSTSTDFRKFLAHTAHYTAYLPWRHILTLFGGYASTHPDISDFHSKGYNGQASLRYEIPTTFFYTFFPMEWEFGFNYKIAKTDLLFVGEVQEIVVTSGLVNISQLVFGFNFAWEVPFHKVLFNSMLFWSPGKILPHETFEAYNNFRPGAKVSYMYTDIMLQYHYDAPYGSVWLQGRGQIASNTLLQSEEFGLGGYDTVRGYNEREFLADNAICLNLELRSPPVSFLPKKCRENMRDEFVVLAFVDYGLGMNTQKIIGEQKNASLIGVGPGIRYMIPSLLSARFDYGFNLHKTRFGSTALGKFHVGVILSF